MKVDDQDLYWDCDEANTDEVRWAELLTQDGVVKPNIFNTFLWLENCRARLDSPSKILPLLESMEVSDQFDLTKRPPLPPLSLERDWRGIEALELLSATAQKGGVFGKPEGENWGEPPFTNNPLEIFLRNIKKGYYPAPELLLSVAKAIDLYFIAHGKLSLEDVFFDPPTTAKQGNYSKRSVRTFKGLSYLDFHEILIEKKSGFAVDSAPVNVEFLALTFLQNQIEDQAQGLSEDDLESFLRGYRRWRRSQSNRADR